MRRVQDFDESGIIQLLQEGDNVIMAPTPIDVVLRRDYVNDFGNRPRLLDRRPDLSSDVIEGEVDA
jgi:hypothetical protein